MPAAGESPDPPPSLREERQPVQDSGSDINQKAGGPNTSSQLPSFPVYRQPSAVISKADVQDSGKKPSEPPPQGWTWTWNEMTFLTIALVIVGSIQAYVYWRQAGYMVEGLRISEKSAQAARDSADVARETLRIGQRAYLGTENWQFRNSEESTPIKIDIGLYNSGATPARVIGAAWQVYMIKQLPPPPDCSQVAVDPIKPMMIQPKRDTVYTVDLIKLLKEPVLAEIRAQQPPSKLVDDKTLRALAMQTVLQGAMPLYLSGFIIYETIDLCFLLALFLQYDAAMKRFVAIGEPGYNYETPYEKNR